MRLTTFQEFEAKLMPTLVRVDVPTKRQILQAVYEAAQHRLDAEDFPELSKVSAETRRKFRSMRKFLEEAVQNTRMADAVFGFRLQAFENSAGSLRSVDISLDLRGVIDHLEASIAMCETLEGDQRLLSRRPRRFDRTSVPSANIQFVIAVGKICEELKYRNVNKLISDAFEAAFGLRYPVINSATARKRLKKKSPPKVSRTPYTR